jgi:tetratricopeptide (TPR) repeat protein
LALLRYALDVALENDVPSASLRAYYNLADLAGQSDRFQEAAEHVRSGLALARRVGNRIWELQFLAQTYAMVELGEWDEVMAMAEQIPEDVVRSARVAATAFLLQGPMILINRGDLEAARALRERFPDAAESADVQERATDSANHSLLFFAEGNHREALNAAQVGIDARHELGLGSEPVKESFVVGMEAALALGELDRVEELLGLIEAAPRGRVPQYLEAHAMRFRARLAQRRGDLAAAEEGLKGAAGLFRELAVPYWMAVSELELAERLADWGRGQEAGPLLTEAVEVFERLRAAPWLERASELERLLSVMKA